MCVYMCQTNNVFLFCRCFFPKHLLTCVKLKYLVYTVHIVICQSERMGHILCCHEALGVRHFYLDYTRIVFGIMGPKTTMSHHTDSNNHGGRQWVTETVINDIYYFL